MREEGRKERARTVVPNDETWGVGRILEAVRQDDELLASLGLDSDAVAGRDDVVVGHELGNDGAPDVVGVELHPEEASFLSERVGHHQGDVVAADDVVVFLARFRDVVADARPQRFVRQARFVFPEVPSVGTQIRQVVGDQARVELQKREAGFRVHRLAVPGHARHPLLPRRQRLRSVRRREHVVAQPRHHELALLAHVLRFRELRLLIGVDLLIHFLLLLRLCLAALRPAERRNAQQQDRPS